MSVFVDRFLSGKPECVLEVSLTGYYRLLAGGKYRVKFLALVFLKSRDCNLSFAASFIHSTLRMIKHVFWNPKNLLSGEMYKIEFLA